MAEAIVTTYNPLLSKVRDIPYLSFDEEQALAKRYRDDNDLSAAHTLVTSHIKLVAHVARDFDGYKLPQEDLVQEGTVGLMKAVKSFDPDRGVRLTSWAVPHIKSEIYQYVTNNLGPVKMVTTKAHRKLFFNLRSMKVADHSLTPSEVQTIAEKLDVKPDDVREMEIRLYARHLPLDRPTDEEYVNPGDYLVADKVDPYDIVSEQEIERKVSSSLQRALSQLDDRSRDIIQQRYMSNDTMGLQELGHKYDISAERVRQIEVAALKKLRKSTFSGATAS